MANIRISSLPAATSVTADSVLPMDGLTTQKIKPLDMINAVRPFASQAEAEAGVVADKDMSPLTTRQAIDGRLPSSSAGRALLAAADDAAQRGLLGLGAAALLNVGSSAGTVAAGDDIRFAGVAGIVDQATAEAGVNNTGIMSPLRTSQWFAAQVGIVDDNKVATPASPAAAVNVAKFSHTQPGTGGLTQYLSTILDDQAIHASRFGVAGDGFAADQTTKLQNAVNFAILSGGGTVYLPRGQIKITAAINCNASGVTLAGEGPFATTLRLATAGQDGIVFGNGVTPITAPCVRDMFFEAATAKTAGRAVHFNNCAQARAENIRALNQFETIRLTDVVVAAVNNVFVTNPTPATGCGIFIDGGNDQYITNFLQGGISGSQPASGIAIAESAGVWLDTCGAIWSGVGLRIQPSGTAVVENIFSRACAWDTNSGYGMYIDAASGTTVRRVQSVGDWFASNGEHGVTVVGAGTVDDIELVSPRAYNNKKHGINLGVGSNLSLVSPRCTGNSQPSPGTYHGINVEGIVGFDIRGGRSRPMAGFANTQGYGLFLNSASADEFVIDGLDVRGNLTGNIINAAGLGPTKLIRNCLGYRTDARIVPAGATTNAGGTVVIPHGLVGTPIGAVATGFVGGGTSPVTLAVVSLDATNVTLRAFVGTSVLASSGLNVYMQAWMG